MKSEKGITLTSLIIYIIGMTIALTTITVLSSYYYENLNSTTISINPLTEFTQFNNFFTQEVNHKNLTIKECTKNYIVFSNKIQYTFVPENKGIYRNHVKICRNVENCSFSKTIKNGKNIITVTMNFKGEEAKTMEYTLK